MGFLTALGWRGVLIFVFLAVIGGQQLWIKNQKSTIEEHVAVIGTYTAKLNEANMNIDKQNEAIKKAGAETARLQSDIEAAKLKNVELEKLIKNRRIDIVRVPISTTCDGAISELRTFMNSSATEWNTKGVMK